MSSKNLQKTPPPPPPPSLQPPKYVFQKPPSLPKLHLFFYLLLLPLTSIISLPHTSSHRSHLNPLLHPHPLRHHYDHLLLHPYSLSPASYLVDPMLLGPREPSQFTAAHTLQRHRTRPFRHAILVLGARHCADWLVSGLLRGQQRSLEAKRQFCDLYSSNRLHETTIRGWFNVATYSIIRNFSSIAYFFSY